MSASGRVGELAVGAKTLSVNRRVGQLSVGELSEKNYVMKITHFSDGESKHFGTFKV